MLGKRRSLVVLILLRNFPLPWGEDDDMIVEQLILDSENINADIVSRVKQVSLTEPNLAKRLVDLDGQVALVSITLNMPDGDKTEATAQVVGSIR